MILEMGIGSFWLLGTPFAFKRFKPHISICNQLNIVALTLTLNTNPNPYIVCFIYFTAVESPRGLLSVINPFAPEGNTT